MFEKIYESAKKAVEENLEAFNKEQEDEKEYIENTSAEERVRDGVEDSKWFVIEGMPDIKKIISDELYDIVNQLKFEVLEYGKRVDEVRYDEYDPVIEYYSVRYKNYKFIINHLSDVDIDEGIFAVYEIENINTTEKIKYYLDLGCRNTGEAKLEYFLLLLDSENEEDFLNKKYASYRKISELLKEKGYTEAVDLVEYKSDRMSGHIKVDDDIYVIPYFGWGNEIRVIVTNSKSWDVNSSNSYGKCGYYVEYKNEDDINVLIDNIEALRKHINGQYGYFENDKYYNNDDIEDFLSVEKTDENGNYRECFNHYHIRIDRADDWDGRGYGNPYINVYTGLEIAKHFKVTFNDAAQWSIGDIINHSDIIVKYDKRIDKNNCILMIRNYQYTEEDDYWMGYDEEEVETIDQFGNDIDEMFLVDEIEFKGSFCDIMDKLKIYLNNMCKIFNIEEVF